MGVVITNTADARAATAGATVRFTVRIRNDGAGDVVDDLGDVLDDADYNGDARASEGSVAYDRGKLRWRGDLPDHGTVTLGFSVTVRCTGGNRSLVNRVGGTAVSVPVLDYSSSAVRKS